MRTFNYFIFLSLILISCSTSYKVKDGLEAYNLKQYHVAIDLLKKEIESSRRTEERSQKMFLIGKSFQELMDYNQALEWYSLAERNNYGANATLNKAYILKNLMRYSEAKENFESLKLIPSLLQEVTKQSAICSSLKLQRESADKNVVIENIFEDLIYSDYSPVIYDYDFLVFTSDRAESTGNEKYKWTGRKYSDLYIADKESMDAQRFDAVINTDNNEGTPAFNSNYTMCVFARCTDINETANQYCKLFLSKRIDGIWSEPIVLPFVKNEINYGHPCFFENDSILIFSSTGEQDAKGFDLWYSEYDGSIWSEALPLPSTINTTADEHFPTADGDTLYFSSNKETGFGGLDIYKTWVNADGSWRNPIHLPFPYNTGADDFGLIIDRFSPQSRNILRQGYLSSSRGNEGRDQIFQFKVIAPSDYIANKEVPDTSNTDEIKEIYLALKVILADKKSTLKKKVAIPRARIDIEEQIFNTDKNGLILHTLDMDKDYIIKIEKDSFLNKSIIVSTKNIKFDNDENVITINREVELDKIERGKEIVLENIYYEYDKWDIREDAKPSLDKLANILHDNPNINIELGSHTDCRGEEEYNIELSRKRAESAVSYLINKGINPSRLSSKGYGESSPAVICICEQCSEDMHQQNRRTTFKIL